MAMYEYKVSRYKGTEVYRFHSVMEVAVFTGLTIQNIRTAVNNNKMVMGYRITRLDMKDKQKAIREYIKDAKKKSREARRCSESDGIIAFDESGKDYSFSSVDEANLVTKIPKLHIRECLNEGCCYEGWTFDYALEKEGCV
mgnify:CR=1 FL=1